MKIVLDGSLCGSVVDGAADGVLKYWFGSGLVLVQITRTIYPKTI